MMDSTVVIGIGNILLKDDGFGVHCVRAMEEEGKFAGVPLVDGGTSTLDLLGYFLDYTRVIVIDCLRAGLSPGTVYRLKPDDLEGYRREHLSLHDVQVLDVLQMARLMGKNPEVILFGVEPADLSEGLELTSCLQEKITMVIGLVEEEIKKGR